VPLWEFREGVEYGGWVVSELGFLRATLWYVFLYFESGEEAGEYRLPNLLCWLLELWLEPRVG